MNTSAEASRLIEQALATTRESARVIQNLVAAHDYQDVAALVTQAAAALLQSASQLMQMQDEAALASLADADDLLDAVYDIIDAETDED
ncbi:MAG: hypothetical protein JNM70_12105 [Anaerolineae bacterium]|nr:hypothetical protein [Anaerolineae bacterium]